MSRKESSFGQLVDYCENGMNKGDEKFSHFHNMYPGAREQIVRDFFENSEYLRRKEGVQMFHEVLSLSRSHELTNEEQKAVLLELVQEYLAERAPECMAYSVIHDEKDHHLHAHIVISSNPIGAEKRHRLSKSDFEKVKKHAEKYVIENHPKMQQEQLIGKKAKSRTSKGESELKRRGGRTTKKDWLHDQLQEIFKRVSSHSELEKALAENGLAMSYRKGKGDPRFGVEGAKQHYRLNTLGLDTEYQQLADGFTEIIEPQEKHKNSKKKPAPDINKQKTKKESQNAKETSSDKTVTPRSAIKENPWQAEAERRFKESQKQSQKPRVRDIAEKTAKEWGAGDFKARDAEAKKAKYKKQNEADAQVRSRKEQSTTENVFETLKEAVAGDFTARDVRARQAKFNKLKKDSKEVKDKSQQTKKERLKERFDEYVKGDFTARDARKFQEKSDTRIEEFRKRSNTAEKEARDKWMRENETREFIDEKVDALDRDNKARLLRAQEAKKRFSKTRTKNEKKKERDRGKDRGR